MPKKKTKLRFLGKKVTSFQGFDTFKRPDGTYLVTCVSDEVTANCPVTNQPDWYLVSITYVPNEKCVESKSLKLYLHSFRNEGMFCEAMADKIAYEIRKALGAFGVEVIMQQKSRGGVSIITRSVAFMESETMGGVLRMRQNSERESVVRRAVANLTGRYALPFTSY